MVGLATAWFLQERDVKVTVFERRHVAAGSSWGNAGWLTPSLTVPLPDPAVLRYGMRALVSPASPVYVPLRPDPQLIRFLVGFVRNSTARRWRRGMQAFIDANAAALAAYDQLIAGGVADTTSEADPFLACFAGEQDRTHLLAELEQVAALGQPIDFELLTGEEARIAQPVLSSQIRAAVRLRGQRFINPGRFVEAVAESVRARGGQLLEGTSVTDLQVTGSAVAVRSGGIEHRLDALVLASGTWLGELARRFGVRQVVQAGRGYSFSVPVEQLPSGPLYFPAQRVACTPLGERLRVAGMMEFRAPDAPLDQRRIRAIVDATRPLLRGVDWDGRADEWVGSRPCTVDGLPLVGPTRSPRVFVAGGHSMWGISLGPLTGRLLAETITTGRIPAQLRPFDPLR